MKFNINNFVKVKLTIKGRRILKERHDKLNHVCNKKPEKLSIKTDKNGYTEFQLHELMNIFGPHMTLGFKPPFLTNIILCDDKEEI